MTPSPVTVRLIIVIFLIVYAAILWVCFKEWGFRGKSYLIATIAIIILGSIVGALWQYIAFGYIAP